MRPSSRQRSRFNRTMSSTLESLKKVYDRVEQTVAETVGSANKTEFSQDLLCRIAMVEDIQTHVSAVLGAMEKHIPHDQRLISSFTASTHSADTVAHSMRDFAKAIENWPKNDKNEYIVQMFLCAEDVFKALSRAEKTYIENAAIHFLSPMKERKSLMTARVDMDYARNKATKAENDQTILEASRATAEFMKQKELVEEEIRNMEEKMQVVKRSLATFVDDLVINLETSLEAVKKLQLIMKKQLDYDDVHGGHLATSGSSPSLPDPYQTETLCSYSIALVEK